MTHLTVKGNLNLNYIEAALLEVLLLWRVPENVEEILVIDNPKYYKTIEKYIPREIRKTFRNSYNEDPTSMSLTWKRFDLVIISISKRDEAYLKKNKKALTGLFAHELMHIALRRKGLDIQIRKDAIKAFKKFAPKLDKLTNYSKQKLVHLFSEVGRMANFVLKDIYANSKLVDLGLGDYILEDYMNLYSKKKSCPVDTFSYNLNEKNDTLLEKLTPALIFELAILPALVPFIRMYHQNKTSKLKIKNFINHISDCYEINVGKIAESYDDLIHLAANKLKDTPEFRQRYYSTLFNKIYHLIE